MKNFMQIGSAWDVMPLLLDLQRQPELWNKNPCRLSKIGPHFESHDISLRYKDETPNFEHPEKWLQFSDEHVPVWYKSIDYLPSARKLIFDLMAAVRGEMLGGVLIYKLQPGKKIHSHSDKGWHADYYDKFNICLQSNPAAYFGYDEECMVQRQGDVHHFRNDVDHCVINEGMTDHIVMTVCIRLDRGFRTQWSPEGFSLDKIGDILCPTCG